MFLEKLFPIFFRKTSTIGPGDCKSNKFFDISFPNKLNIPMVGAINELKKAKMAWSEICNSKEEGGP